MKSWLCGLCTLISVSAFAQQQTCPVNINFSMGNLTHWYAYTGNNHGGNGQDAIKQRYDSTSTAPAGTIGETTIFEYNLPGIPGIQTITSNGIDPFGGFPTIPVINGYHYNYSILLGSTAVSHGGVGGPGAGVQGGYIRGVSYRIKVPTTPATQPYTMTYAYAMVLENGTHNSNEQPLISATLTTNDSVITCASPSYYLPTFNNTTEGGRGATLDSAAAKANGFKPSDRSSPNPNPDISGQGGTYLKDVWTKGWTEVTFDLSPYRGQTVTLTFEADNCVPGGHFAYGYIALRNDCAGLIISGQTLVCTNSDITYSIPALTGASYKWSVPPGWTITSGNDSSIMTVTAGKTAGSIIAHEVNSCANLSDTIQVSTTPPSIPGKVNGDTTVCAGENENILALKGYQGTILKWISSTDGINWKDISDSGPGYIAMNLNTTTEYRALVQNGSICNIDTSAGALIVVDPKSVGGNIDPLNTNICDNQTTDAILNLVNSTGSVINWQSSLDGLNWQDFNPAYTNSSFNAKAVNTSTQYRLIVKSGVCDADTSSIAFVKIFHVPFPQSNFNPADTTICYGATIPLNASVTIGTNYAWQNNRSLRGAQMSGDIGSLPFAISAQASPLSTTNYVLGIQNEGCPNTLNDTFHIAVLPPIIVDAGNDTSIVANQPLQLNATVNDPAANIFTWSPETGLSNPGISDPIAFLGANIDAVRYVVRATNSVGCYGEDDIVVKVFKTGPDIFVPNAFTPGKNSNNIFRPIPVGISSLQYFRVFNRNGRMVFSTTQIGQGWDGTVDGKPQDSQSYVWMVQGIDYTGKLVTHKGVMTLIR